MHITLLGTGHAGVTECYNTCFVIADNDVDPFMVDGGGGFVLRQLKHAGIAFTGIHDLFVTHKHLDHLVGVMWMMRMVGRCMETGAYTGDLRIYAHDEVIAILQTIAQKVLQPEEARFIGDRVRLIEVHDGETRTVCGRAITFFDIHSTKAKQFGFSMQLPQGGRLVCCGDEPCTEASYPSVRECDWLLHEAFCLHAQAEVFHPYEKHHSTVQDACRLAERMHVRNLVLYHTEDQNLAERKRLYAEEGKAFYTGNLFIPDDLETIAIDG